MPEKLDKIVPESVASDIELLVQGRGPFTDAEELSLKREEDISIPDPGDPQIEDDANAVQASVQARLAVLEQALLVSQAISSPILLPDQNVEFGLATGGFTSGTTITIDPCDVDGNDTSEPNLVVYLRADRTSATETIANGAVLTWNRFDVRETGGVAGVLVGGLGSSTNGTGPSGRMTMTDYWFDCQGSEDWADVDSATDFANSNIISVAHYDAGAPTTVGDPSHAALTFWNALQAASKNYVGVHDIAEEYAHVGQGYFKSGTAVVILQFSVGAFGDFFLRVGADGLLEAKVENFAQRFYVRVTLLASGNLPVADAIVIT